MCRGRHFAWETTFAAGISAASRRKRRNPRRSPCGSGAFLLHPAHHGCGLPKSGVSHLRFLKIWLRGADRGQPFQPRGIRMDLHADPPSAMTSWGRSSGCRGWNAAPQTKSRPSGAAGLGEEGQRNGRRALPSEKSETERICKEKSAIFG